MKDMSSRLDEAEQMALKGGKKIIQKLEGKVNNHCSRCRSEVRTICRLRRGGTELMNSPDESRPNDRFFFFLLWDVPLRRLSVLTNGVRR